MEEIIDVCPVEPICNIVDTDMERALSAQHRIFIDGIFG
jgi:hypothetical protein